MFLFILEKNSRDSRNHARLRSRDWHERISCVCTLIAAIYSIHLTCARARLLIRKLYARVFS